MAFAVTHRATSTGGTTDAATRASASFTPAANSLLVVFAQVEGNAAGTAEVPSWSISNTGGLTFTKRVESPSLSAAYYGTIVCWTAQVGGSPSAMTVTVDPYSGSSTGWISMSVFDVTGHDTTTPIVQSAAENEDNNYATPGTNISRTTTVTLGSAADTDNLLLAGFAGTSDAGSIPSTPTSFTSIGSAAGPYESIRTAYRTSTTQTTVASTATCYFNFGAVVEIAAAGGGSDATVSAAAIAATASVPTPTITRTATVAATAIAATAALPAPTIVRSATVPAAAIAATAAVPTPTIVRSATVVATAIAAVAGVPTPTIARSATVAAAAIAATASVPTPTVTVGGDATVSAAAIAATAGVPTPTVTRSATVTVAAVAATAAVPAPTVTRSATVAAAAIAATAGVPTPTIVRTSPFRASVSGRMMPTGLTNRATRQMHAGRIYLSLGNAVVTPAAIAATVGVPAPTITRSATVTVVAIAAVVTVPAPTVDVPSPSATVVVQAIACTVGFGATVDIPTTVVVEAIAAIAGFPTLPRIQALRRQDWTRLRVNTDATLPEVRHRGR